MKILREDAIKIIEIITDKPDPYWDNIIEHWIIMNNIDLKTSDSWPTIYDLLEALGISKEEYERVISKC